MGRKKPVKSKGDVGEEKMVASASGSEEKITLLPVNTKLIWQLQVLFLFLWFDRVLVTIEPPPLHTTTPLLFMFTMRKIKDSEDSFLYVENRFFRRIDIFYIFNYIYIIIIEFNGAQV